MYEVYVDAQDQYRWKFKAHNGKIIAVSSESYVRKEDCIHSIEIVKQAVGARVMYEEQDQGLNPI